MHVVYTGERVRLRPFADFAEFNSVQVEDYALPDPFRGPRWWAVAAREQEFGEAGMINDASYSTFAIQRLDTGELAGVEGCSHHVPGLLGVNIGTFLLPPHRGLGLGVEAKQLMLCRLFESYPIEVVRATTLQDHAAARASLERCGMRYCGSLRGIQCTAGRFDDEVQYQILREEWLELPIRRIVRRGAA